jgi:hypothetical protein
MERHTFSIDPVVGDRLKAIKARSGLSESEQVRRNPLSTFTNPGTTKIQVVSDRGRPLRAGLRGCSIDDFVIHYCTEGSDTYVKTLMIPEKASEELD